MKISRESLQEFFEQPLPSITEIADAYTFHAFEIDSIDGDVLDVKVLPNRAADCNSAEGLARELAAILDRPSKALRVPGAPLPPVTVSLAQINALLGSDFALEEVQGVFKRLDLDTHVTDDVFTITPPADRPDLVIPEDIIEEVGRILGYERLPLAELPPTSKTPDQARYRGIERMKDQLIEQGYIEVSTQSFAKKGDFLLANPLDTAKPALRTSLEENLQDALTQAKYNAPLVLPPAGKPKLFEVGTVFPKEGEHLELRMTERVEEWGLPAQAGDAAGISDNLSVAKLEDYGKEYAPKRYELGAYKSFSLYPFIARDIALWVPVTTEASDVENLIRGNAGELLMRLDQFDRFEKEGRISLAFRLVFQSTERTLTDVEVHSCMEKVVGALSAKGYEVR